MTERQLDDFMAGEGYAKIPSNLPEFTVYFRPENNCVNVMHVIDYRSGLYISEDQYEHIKAKIEALFSGKGIAVIHILSLVISGDLNKARQLCGDDALCWVLDPFADRLVIYENQVSDFYGMRGRLEYWLSHIPETPAAENEDVPEKGAGRMKRKNFHPAATVTLVCINILVFIICTFSGDLLYNIGAFSAERLTAYGEYYRIVTSMFLHWDMDHLFGNMLILFYMGEVVEKHFGHVRFLLLYLMAGICGNLLSMGYELYTGSLTVSAGASGAIFGAIGGLLILVLIHRGHLEQITLGRLAIMIVYSLYSGFVGSHINNAAHIGGFLSGTVTALLLWMTGGGKKKMRQEQTRDED